MNRAQTTFAVLALGASSAFGQQPTTFPFDANGVEPLVGGVVYQPVAQRITQLAALDATTLTDVVLPDGRVVALDLLRIRPERMQFRYYLDGVERSDLLDGSELSIWKGAVRGESNSDVMLSFSQVGSQGWIDSRGERIHLSARPDAAGNWWNGDAVLVAESGLIAAGMHMNNICEAVEPATREALELPATAGGAAGTSSSGASAPLLGPGCALRECTIALETDYQYFQRFNNANAQAVYTTTLWSFISDRYESQVSTILTFPYVGFYSTPADPWATPETAGQTGVTQSTLLNEFVNAWQGAIPNGARIAHFMSGALLGGGVAYLNVLCSTTANFGVAANFNGTINFPIVQQPNNWDFIVSAHELGHNFNAAHTHSYCPPLDECPPSQYFGQCQTQQVCSSSGTIMSYCHLCSGGTANITTFFHPTSAQFMTQAAQNCLPFYADISGSTPTVLANATPTPVVATASGAPTGAVQLLWRANASGAFTVIAMQSIGGDAYAADLPAFGCGDSPQYYYAFDDVACGLLTYPAGAPASVFSAVVGTLQTNFSDNFETNMGWTATNLGASSGDWQRGVPVNDPSWAYDPASDADGSGACWLTQNQLGNTDVDGGAVQLLSPVLDLSASGAGIAYSYYLTLTNSNGDDRLLVEISSNGAAGPWIEIARHTNDLGSSWSQHSIPGAVIAGAGAPLGANMRVRFTANDGGTQSIVEAGLDAFSITGLNCNGIGVNYCTSTVNSSGSAAVLTASGSNSLLANDLALHAAPLPLSSNGIYFFGASAIQVPFGNGVRCVASPSVRFPNAPAVGGALDLVIDNTQNPASSFFAAGTTLNFQAWFRDAAAGGAFFNLSDGFRITLTP